MEVESGVRATALQVAAEALEEARFVNLAGGVYAAFALALDYLGFWLVMVSGRPGFDQLGVSLKSDSPALLSLDAKRTSEQLMENGHSRPEWKEALLEAIRLIGGGKPLMVSTITTPTLAIIGTQLADGVTAVSLTVSTPSISLCVSLGEKSVMIHPFDSQVGMKIVHFLAEEGYRVSCGETPRQGSDKCLFFAPNCREQFRMIMNAIGNNQSTEHF